MIRSKVIRFGGVKSITGAAWLEVRKKVKVIFRFRSRRNLTVLN